MDTNDLIQVLWIEDDPEVTSSFPLEAESEGIQLVPYGCWDDGYAALLREYDRWQAIVLDAKCKYHKDSRDNAILFLGQALKDIAVAAKDKGRVIPWYVLTGHSEEDIADVINDDRNEWDQDWTESKSRKFYSKNTDRVLLYSRIRYHAKDYMAEFREIHNIYKDVFAALKKLEINSDVSLLLEDLLVPIHFHKRIRDKDYNDKFKKIRISLEYIFSSMMQNGILPDMGRNLTWPSYLLSGKDCLKDKMTVIKSRHRIVPEIMGENVQMAVRVTSADVHAKSNIKEYMESVGNTTYLLKSLVFQLCDFILWYSEYIDKYHLRTDKEISWDVLKPDLIEKKK